MDLQGLGQKGGRLWEQELPGLLLLPGMGEVGAPAGLGAGAESGWRDWKKGFAFGDEAGRQGLDKAASVMGAVTLVVARNQGRTEPKM